MRIWALLAVCSAMACGGQVSGASDAGADGRASSSSGSAGSSGGGSGGNGSSGGGSGGPVDLCPPDPPTVGVSCVSDGLGCAYAVGGQCVGLRCRNGSWQMDPTVTCP